MLLENDALDLRDYQSTTMDGVRNGIRRGLRRILLSAPTGSGKTIVAVAVIQRALERGNRVAFLVERNVLVAQTIARLREYGVSAGILQGANTRNTNSPVLVCSQQTLEARDIWPDSELIIVDECHVQRKWISHKLRHGLYPRQWAIGLTATPLVAGLGDTWQEVLTVRTTQQLIDEHWLLPLRVFACRAADMTGCKPSSTKEWRGEDLTARGRVIIGDVVSTWQTRVAELGMDAPKTLCFSATVEHGSDLVAAFNAADIPAAQVSYLDTDSSRDIALERFARGDARVLVGVDVLTRGFDDPEVEVLIDAHPYRKALAAYIQMIGRAMRPREKVATPDERAIVFDHSGNYVRFYDAAHAFWSSGVDQLVPDGGEVEIPEGGERAPVECRRCGTLIDWTRDTCVCGTPKPQKQPGEQRGGTGSGDGAGVTTVDGESVEVDGLDRSGGKWKQDDAFAWGQLYAIALARRPDDKTRAWKHALMLHKDATGHFPPGGIRHGDPARVVDERVQRWVQSRYIRYAKSRARAS